MDSRDPLEWGKGEWAVVAFAFVLAAVGCFVSLDLLGLPFLIP